MSQERISLSNLQANASNQPAPGDVDYSPPAALAPLPSKGLVYPLEHPFHGVDEVEIRAMTTKDEDILSSRALLKTNKAIDTLIRSCLQNRSVDPMQLLVGDRNAILVMIRVSGYGNEYKPEVECPHCEVKGRLEPPFNLLEMNIKPLGAEPLQPGVNAFRYTLPVSKKEVAFKLLTGADERELSNILEQQRKSASRSLTVEATVTTRLWMHVLQIGAETDRNKLLRIIQNLSPRDSRALRKYIADIEPTMEMGSKTFTCPACGESAEVDVPMTVDFFWPSDETVSV